MKKTLIRTGKSSLPAVMAFISLFLFLSAAGSSFAGEIRVPQEQEQERFALAEKKSLLVSFTDYYCSFFLSDTKNYSLRVEGAYDEEEQILLSDGDVLYVNQGKGAGLEEGQVFVAVQVKEKIGSPYKSGRSGFLALKRGLVRIIDIGENVSRAKVERCCSPVRVGDFLFPYQDFDELRGDDLGFDVDESEIGETRGRVIYLQHGNKQLGPGYRGIIDLGTEDGLSFGDQIIAFHKKKMLEPFANLIIIDARSRTATVKVLSCKDVVREGDWVALRTSETSSR